MRACLCPRILAPVFAALAYLSLGACAPFLDAAGLDLFQDAEPEPAPSDYENGKAEFVAGHMGLAVLHFQAALVEQPDSVQALNGLGAAFDRLGRYDLSGRAYGRALDLAPDDVQTLNNLGYSYLLQGRHELAVAYLRGAAVLSGGDVKVRNNRILAEDALAQARGPGREGAGTAASENPGANPFSPHLVRGGKSVKHLVTQRSAEAAEMGPRRRGDRSPDLTLGAGAYRDGLPGFAAAPMALDGPEMRSAGLKALRPVR